MVDNNDSKGRTDSSGGRNSHEGQESFPVDHDTDSQFLRINDIARGSTSYVEEVKEIATGRSFARKRFIADRPKHRKAILEVFANEVKTIRRLEGHVHFVRVHAAYATDRNFNLVLEPRALDGDLAMFLDSYLQGNLPAVRRAAMTSTLEQALGCLASGLAFMHEHKIRHKDIKPGNILLNQGTVYWADFGYAKNSLLLEHSDTTGGVDGGITDRYAAFEVLCRGERNSKSDVFSLGCVYMEIYFAVVHNDVVPHSGRIYAHKMGDLCGQLAEDITSRELEQANLSGPKLIALLICNMGLATPAKRPDANTLCFHVLAPSHPGYGCAGCRARLSGQVKGQHGRNGLTSIRELIKLSEFSRSSKRQPSFEEQGVVAVTLKSTPPQFMPRKGPVRQASSTDKGPLVANASQPLPVREKYQHLQETQKKALKQSGIAFNLIKKFLIDCNLELPLQIQYAFEDANTWNDRLEKEEVDFKRVKEAYDAEQWIYTGQEPHTVANEIAQFEYGERFTPALLGGTPQKLTDEKAGSMKDGITYEVPQKQDVQVVLTGKPPVGADDHQGDMGDDWSQTVPKASVEAQRPSVNDLIPVKRKGILKVPTVRFSEDTEVSAQPFQQPSPPPPPPPPPSLPPPPPPSPPSPPKYYGILPPPPPPSAPLPPSLFTDDIDANEYLNSAAFKLYTQFLDDLSVFVDHQSRVIGLRLGVQEKRVMLRRLREEVSRCDTELITSVHKCMATEVSLDDARIMALFEAAQSARDLVGPAEVEYEPMEIMLGAEEHKLTDKYERLVVRFEQFFRLKANPSKTQWPSPPSMIEYEEPSEATSDSVHEVENSRDPRDVFPLHGAWIGDQVAVGEIPVRATGAIDEDPQRQQRNVRWPISSSEDLSNPQLSSIATWKWGNDEISTELFGVDGTDGAGVMRSGSVGWFSDTSFDEFIGSTELEDELSSSPLFELNNPLLLSILPPDQGTTLPAFLDEVGLKQCILREYLSHFENAHDRVDRWILHQLRLSRRQAFDLQRAVSGSAPHVHDWGGMVLQEWSNDALGQDKSYSHGSIEGETSVSAEHHVTLPHVRGVT